MLKKGKKPDLVVMDLNLSGSEKYEDMEKQLRGEQMDGVRTTKEIKIIDPKANIIGFTAYAHLEWGERLRKSGARYVFGREIGFDGFAEKIEIILKKNLPQKNFH